MAPPPAKRQKRLVVLSSDDDDDDDDDKVPVPPKLKKHEVRKNHTRLLADNGTAKQSLPTRSRAKPRESIVKRSRSSTAPGASSETPDRKSKATIGSQGSKPISTFFHSATQPQLLHRQKKPKAISQELENEAEDSIQDDSPIEELDELLRAQRKIGSVSESRKRQEEDTDNVPSGSRRFKLAGDATKNDANKPVSRKEVHLTPWALRFGPSNLEELMVHKKKVLDVQTWLDNVLQGRDTKVCLYTPPSRFHN